MVGLDCIPYQGTLSLDTSSQIGLNSLAPAAVGALCVTAKSHTDGRGRDEDYSSPPAQIPACAANAPGSSLGFWRRSGDRAKGVVS